MNQLAKGTLFVFLIFSFCCVVEKDIQTPVTTATLFEEMVDMISLTYFPSPAFKTVQYSSFDRRSNLPNGADWFANSDGFGGEPVPNFERILMEPDEEGMGEYLIAEIEGPGAIVRLWTAAIEGTIRLYLDDEENPLYDGPALDFFHQFYDSFPEIEALDTGRFRETIYQQDACYAPIPFSRGMRLIWRGDVKTIHFYQVGLRMYEEGTRVISFNPQDIIEYKNVIDRVTTILLDPDEKLIPRSQSTPVFFQSALEPFEKTEVISLTGPQAVEILTLSVQAGDRVRALRQTVMSVTLDGFSRPQVESPVGDFFGAAPGINPYRSMPFTVNPDGTMICRYAIPFKETLQLNFENFGDQPVEIQGSVLPAPYEWDEERSMHFRARWRVDHDLIASNTDVQDLPFLIATGKGLYVGTTSYLLNPNDVPTPSGSWWGEGDEKIFIDDDSVPSTFGTGSEDYYNYSWSIPDIFYFPYCGQPRNDGPGNRGYVTNFRWHILDPLPFNNNIRFYMEIKSHERTPGMSYARIGYHYAKPGVTDDHLAVMPEDARLPQLPDGWQPAARRGARNSVFFAAEDIVGNRRQTHLSQDRLWQGGKILIWTPNARADAKTFTFAIEETGKIRIHVVFALTPDSGRISFLLDGEKAALANGMEILDLNRPYRTLLRNFTFPAVELKTGQHTLTMLFEGAGSQVANPEIGVDFLWVQKQ